jgi:hypothetical protein
MKKPSELIYNDGKIFSQSPVALATLANYGVANNPVDILFSNFVAYASANWTYRTSSDTTDEGLINGTGGTITACATIANAFRLLVNKYYPDMPESPISLDSSSQRGHFLVKPGLKCFDPKSIGNIGNYGAKSASEFGVATFFPNHYLAKVGTKYYDPCLMATYISPDGPIGPRTKDISFGRKNPGGIKKVGNGAQLMFLVTEQKPVPGFSTRLQLLLPKELKKILDNEGVAILKNDPDVKIGGFF